MCCKLTKGKEMLTQRIRIADEGAYAVIKCVVLRRSRKCSDCTAVNVCFGFAIATVDTQRQVICDVVANTGHDTPVDVLRIVRGNRVTAAESLGGSSIVVRITSYAIQEEVARIKAVDAAAIAMRK